MDGFDARVAGKLGRRIKRRRRFLDLSQETLAERADIHPISSEAGSSSRPPSGPTMPDRGQALAVAERLGQNLRRVRRREDLSQERLARLASLHRTEIGLLEQGRRVCRIDTLVRPAGAMAVPPGEVRSAHRARSLLSSAVDQPMAAILDTEDGD